MLWELCSCCLLIGLSAIKDIRDEYFACLSFYFRQRSSGDSAARLSRALHLCQVFPGQRLVPHLWPASPSDASLRELSVYRLDPTDLSGCLSCQPCPGSLSSQRFDLYSPVDLRQIVADA